jgi:hypothetical protein
MLADSTLKGSDNGTAAPTPTSRYVWTEADILYSKNGTSSLAGRTAADSRIDHISPRYSRE